MSAADAAVCQRPGCDHSQGIHVDGTGSCLGYMNGGTCECGRFLFVADVNRPDDEYEDDEPKPVPDAFWTSDEADWLAAYGLRGHVYAESALADLLRDRAVPDREGATEQLADRCYEEVTRKGQLEPCEKPAVAMRIDPNEGTPYPVCVKHTRADMVPLAAVIVAAGWRRA